MSTFTNIVSVKTKFQAVLLAVTLGLPLFASSSEATVLPINHTWYVSALATRVPRPQPVKIDGRSWATAFPEFNLIDWTQVNDGDVINVEGGVFHTPLEIKKERINVVCGFSPLTHRLDTGRDGVVSIVGPGGPAGDKGIRTLGHSSISISAPTWRSLIVSGWNGGGVIIDPASSNIKLTNIEIYNNGPYNTNPELGTGLVIKGSVTCSQLLIHDNKGVNISFPEKSPTEGYLNSMNSFKRCWIYGTSTYSPVCDGARSKQVSTTEFNSCIFGPGLNTGITLDHANDAFYVRNCLFINPAKTNVARTANAGPISGFFIQNIISFLTPLNAMGQAHSCLDMGPSSISAPRTGSVSSSYFYGGTVVATGPQTSQYGNKQYKTSGNTAYLSPSQTPFSFTTDVSRIANNALISELSNADYTPIPFNRNANSITSVKQLLSTNQP